MNNLADFKVDKELCIGCGLCVRACPAMLIELGQDRKAQIKEVKTLDWYGCWGCQHCLAVCPQGAVSVLGKVPENSLPMAGDGAARMIDSLIAGRRSCRHFQDRNVDKKELEEMFKVLENAPTGGNKQKAEYTIIDDREEMKKFQKMVHDEMERQAGEGIYARSFDEESYQIMKDREQQAMNGDMLFCSAPHLLIVHMPKKFGSCGEDTTIISTYFELMCAARQMGAVILKYPLNVLNNMPEIKAKLKIPEDHHVGAAIGFGYPEFSYARGVQKEGKAKIHRLTF